MPDLHAHLEDSWLVNEAGERIENVELGEKIRFHAVFEAREKALDRIPGRCEAESIEKRRDVATGMSVKDEFGGLLPREHERP